jgi:cell division protein FtsB
MPEKIDRLADLLAALAEHVVDLERRVDALESGSPMPKRIAASDLRRVAKALMRLSLGAPDDPDAGRTRST